MAFGRRGFTIAQPFGRRKTDMPPPPVPVRSADRPIIVPRMAFDAESPYELVQAVVNFVNFALHDAQFNRDEISPNALRSFHTDYYAAQVKNGGHGQFAANSAMQPPVMGDCEEGLRSMAHPAGSVLDRFLEFARREPMRFRKVIEGGGFGVIDPAIDGFDKEFLAIDRQNPVIEANRRWLKSLAELRVVPDAEHKSAMRDFAAANTQAAFRKEEREKARQEADARDPLKQAMSYLCLMADEPRRFKAWLQGQPGHDLGDGVKVVRFILDTDKGRCSAFFHPKIAVLIDDAAGGDPIARIPTDMVVDYVHDRTGQDLLDVLRG